MGALSGTDSLSSRYMMSPILSNHLIITTLSPLLTVNDYGHPDAHFPKGELAEALGPRGFGTKTMQ